MATPTFRWPYDGTYPISSPYGPRPGGFHPGVDLACPPGTPILACAPGTVTYNAYEDGAGNTVTIVHEDGWETRYDHLLNWVTQLGQGVASGQLIGYSDTTGVGLTGPHLHLEIRPDHNTTTDPIPYLTAGPGPAPVPEPVPVTEDDMAIIKENRDGGQTPQYWLVSGGGLVQLGDGEAYAWAVNGHVPVVEYGTLGVVSLAQRLAKANGQPWPPK